MNVHTYADGFGTWHAVVTGHRSEMDAARAARAAIRRELTERGDIGKGVRLRVALAGAHPEGAAHGVEFVESWRGAPPRVTVWERV